MPFYFEWYVQDRIILGSPVGNIIPADYDTAPQEIIRMIEAGNAPVHLIYDMRHIGEVQAPLAQVIQSGRVYLRHPKFGWGLTFGQKQNRLLSFMAAAAAQTFGVRNRNFNTAEEAQDFLQDMDNTLRIRDLPPPYFTPK